MYLGEVLEIIIKQATCTEPFLLSVDVNEIRVENDDIIIEYSDGNSERLSKED